MQAKNGILPEEITSLDAFGGHLLTAFKAAGSWTDGTPLL
jgi:hypothetical protein